MTPLRPLTPIEARVLATLMEKARTVPDTYPLSLNLVVTGCNQKSSRDPVMTLTDADAQQALDELKRLGLVLDAPGSRVARYEHNFQRGLGVPEQSAVLLGLLMLRGPQTAGELRIHSDRWYRFADISSVEAFLDELAERPAEKGGPLVQALPRAPGTREVRWAHRLCGPVAAPDASYSIASDSAHTRASGPMDAETPAWADRLLALEAKLARLSTTVQRLCDELGLPAADTSANANANAPKSDTTPPDAPPPSQPAA